MKEKALELRDEGKTYKEISEVLGVSVDWCKRNLKGTRKEHPDKPLIEALVRISTKPGGCSDKDAIHLMYEHYKQHRGDLKPNIYEIKKSVRRLAPNAIFLPAWMSQEYPHDSHSTLMTEVNGIYEYVEDRVQEYLNKYSNIDPNSLRRELCYLVFPFSSTESVSSRLERFENILQSLPTTPPPVTPEEFPPLDPPITLPEEELPY